MIRTTLVLATRAVPAVGAAAKRAVRKQAVRKQAVAKRAAAKRAGRRRAAGEARAVAAQPQPAAGTADGDRPLLLSMENITKTFPGVVALSGASLRVGDGNLSCPLSGRWRRRDHDLASSRCCGRWRSRRWGRWRWGRWRWGRWRRCSLCEHGGRKRQNQEGTRRRADSLHGVALLCLASLKSGFALSCLTMEAIAF